MVLDLVLKLVPWAIAAAILFFLILILQNKNRLHKIRYSGRVSEIIDRRRNIVWYIVAIIVLIIMLVIDLRSYYVWS